MRRDSPVAVWLRHQGQSVFPSRRGLYRRQASPARSLWPELGREVGDDAVAQHVGHLERLRVDLVVGGDVAGPIADVWAADRRRMANSVCVGRGGAGLI